mgnify:CR=1 FL=1
MLRTKRPQWSSSLRINSPNSALLLLGTTARVPGMPYSLAEAGIPLAALGAGAFPLAKWREAHKTSPAFVQLDLSI